MDCVYRRSNALSNVPTSFCPGCMHSTALKILCEVSEELGIKDDLVLLTPIGCAVFAGAFVDFDSFGAPHGRPGATGTGFKRSNPEIPLVLYQGDGDCASIGIAETLHAANRGEGFTVIMVNNQVYGMTGGQAAPTTLPGQKTTTSQYGKSIEEMGDPIKLAEIIATLKAPKYVTRQALHTPKNILAAKKSIKKALEIQIHEGGYSFIELISACPTNWKMDPKDTLKYMDEIVLKEYPVGDLKG